MGTSISHPSPSNNNWNPVKLGYQTDKIPLERILSEIWRASENQDNTVSDQIRSEVVYRCHEIVSNSSSASEAIQSYSRLLRNSGQNSIVAEFAKRAIASSYAGSNPAGQWRSSFFSELTNYYISRDANGYVGSQFRNTSVSELREFKSNIKQEVSNRISKLRPDPKSHVDWQSFINQAINSILQKGGRL